MKNFNLKITFLLILCYLLPLILHASTAEGQNLLQTTLKESDRNSTTTYKPWLTRIKNPRLWGCKRQPWICNVDYPRTRRRCCRNRCVDVSSDVNNCGWCGIRCRFTRQCCSGICVDTNVNPFNCGRCNHRCRFPSFCVYGMCGYAQALPPFPFPFPHPPRPHPPVKPFPPKGSERRRSPPVLAAS
ncbi:stigma-specific STIG1-like protein 4 [Salvia miltiorrhiza]|uniref:stigma-specific STIG1-like protein 4 n=1 Tax=Salvia miltiorrhiza TaxID=226208 RepID=UPI0025ABBC60|nr:stigma-specific STIG1-like protein 4 [Salvia miltiorrhiza]